MNTQQLEAIAEDVELVLNGWHGHRRSKSLPEEAEDLLMLGLELSALFRGAKDVGIGIDDHDAKRILEIIARDRRLALSGSDLDEQADPRRQRAPIDETNALLVRVANGNPDALPEIVEIMGRIHGGHGAAVIVIDFLMKWGRMKATPALELFASIHGGDPGSAFGRLKQERRRALQKQVEQEKQGQIKKSVPRRRKTSE